MVKMLSPLAAVRVQSRSRDAWIAGFAVGLAEMHRRLLGGNDSKSVCAVAKAAGLTLDEARAAGVADFDVRELAKAGVL